MIEDADRNALAYVEAGCGSVTFHVEAAKAPVRLAREIRSHGARASMALKPATPIEPYEDLLPELDMLLIMTVEPGFGGQKFLDLCLPKIRRARAMLRPARRRDLAAGRRRRLAGDHRAVRRGRRRRVRRRLGRLLRRRPGPDGGPAARHRRGGRSPSCSGRRRVRSSMARVGVRRRRADGRAQPVDQWRSRTVASARSSAVVQHRSASSVRGPRVVRRDGDDRTDVAAELRQASQTRASSEVLVRRGQERDGRPRPGAAMPCCATSSSPNMLAVTPRSRSRLVSWWARVRDADAGPRAAIARSRDRSSPPATIRRPMPRTISSVRLSPSSSRGMRVHHTTRRLANRSSTDAPRAGSRDRLGRHRAARRRSERVVQRDDDLLGRALVHASGTSPGAPPRVAGWSAEHSPSRDVLACSGVGEIPSRR